MGVFDTLAGALDAAVERDPDHPLLRCDGIETTVGTLQTGSRNVAAALRRWGIEPGDRTAIMMRNVPEFVSVWFGVARSGSIEVPVHTAHRGPLLEHILGESQARVLFCDAEFVSRLDGLELPALERIVVRGDDPPRLAGVVVHQLAEALADQPHSDGPPLAGDSVSCILYTSGTTGPSKGVRPDPQREPRARTGQHRADGVHVRRRPLHGVPALPRQRQVHVGDLGDDGRRPPGARRGLQRVALLGRDARRGRHVVQLHGRAAVDPGEAAAAPPTTATTRDARLRRRLPADALGAVRGALRRAAARALRHDRGRHRGAEHEDRAQAGGDGQARAVLRDPARGRGRPPGARRARSARSRSARASPASSCASTGAAPTRRSRRSATCGSTPATARAWTRTASCSTSTASRTRSGAAARTSPRTSSRRWSARSTPSSSAPPTASPPISARTTSWSPIVPDPERGVDVEALIVYCEEQLASFAVPRYIRIMDRLPKNSSQRIEKFRLRDEAVTAETIDRGPRAGARPGSPVAASPQTRPDPPA